MPARRTLRRRPGVGVWAVIVVLLGGHALAQQPADWNQLTPPAAAVEINAFDSLSDTQADALREIARGRALLSLNLVPTEAARVRDAHLVAALGAEGLDAEAWLARRDAWMARRKSDAEAPVPTLNGAPARLAGYLLPALEQDGRVIEFVLVPWAGACSHMPAPPPNQSVRIRPDPIYTPKNAQEAVSVSGLLTLRAQSAKVFAIDGVQWLHSSYAIDGATVTALPPR